MSPVAKVWGLGAMNMDHFYRVERLLKDGEGRVEEARAYPGGSAANTVYALARLGLSCGFLGVVGEDEDGRRLVQDLREGGVDTSRIVVKRGVATGSVVAVVDKQGHRALYVHPGANGHLHWVDIGWTQVSPISHLHLSAFVGQEQFRLQVEAVSRLEAGVTLSFAPGALYARRGLKALEPILRRTNVLFLNRKELKELTGAEETDAVNSCLAAGCQQVVVTQGKGRQRGGRTLVALVAIGKERTWIAASPQAKEVIDTTGAGDAFAAGYLYGFSNGLPVPACGLLGDIMAGFCISRLGARPSLPTLPQLLQLYREAVQAQPSLLAEKGYPLL